MCHLQSHQHKSKSTFLFTKIVDIKFGLHDGDKFLVALLRHDVFQLFVADVVHEFVASFQNVEKPKRGKRNQVDFDKNYYGFSIITKIAKKSCEFFS